MNQRGIAIGILSAFRRYRRVRVARSIAPAVRSDAALFLPHRSALESRYGPDVYAAIVHTAAVIRRVNLQRRWQMRAIDLTFGLTIISLTYIVFLRFIFKIPVYWTSALGGGLSAFVGLGIWFFLGCHSYRRLRRFERILNKDVLRFLDTKFAASTFRTQPDAGAILLFPIAIATSIAWAATPNSMLMLQGFLAYFSTLSFYIAALGSVTVITNRFSLARFLGVQPLYYNDAIILNYVCDLLRLVPYMRVNTEVQQLIFYKLNEVVVMFRHVLPASLGTTGRRDEVVDSTFALIAAHIQRLRTWVAFPQNSTEADLQRELAEIGAASATKLYHFLIPDEPVDVIEPSPKTRAANLLSFLGAILVALLPGALLVAVVGPAGVHLESATVTAWTLASVAWAAANLLLLDPRFGEKLEATKAIAQIVGQKDSTGQKEK